MKNLLNLTESEKTRILNLHKSAIKKEFLFEQRMDAEGKNVEMYNNDKDYDYKKEGDKYFFKLKATPVSEKAKVFLAQKKFINWTEAKPGPGLDAIKKLPFQAVAPKPEATDGSDEAFAPPVQTTNTATTPLPVKSLSSMTVQNNVGNQQLATGTQPTGTQPTGTQPTGTQPTGTQPTGQAVTTQTNPEVSADLKSASQIRQEFRQGKRDIAKLQRERGKLYKTFNKLSGKMDNATKQSYLDNIAELDKLLSQK